MRVTRPHAEPAALAPTPAPAELGRLIDRIVAHVHPSKHDAGPIRLTHERPFFEVGGRLGGAQIGVTISELHQLRAKSGIEVIQVVDTFGNSNLETVLWRREIGRGQRFEFQGPALNTRVSGGLPLDLRVCGLGITGDAIDPKAKEAVSYTVEAKLHVSDLVMLGGTGAAARAAALLGEGVSGEVATLVAEACASVVPIVGGLIALSSARWAHKTLRSRTASTQTKVLAVAHAVSDAVRIFMPLVGTLGNAALVGVALWLHKRERKALAPAPSAVTAQAPPGAAQNPAALAHKAKAA